MIKGRAVLPPRYSLSEIDIERRLYWGQLRNSKYVSYCPSYPPIKYYKLERNSTTRRSKIVAGIFCCLCNKVMLSKTM